VKTDRAKRRKAIGEILASLEGPRENVRSKRRLLLREKKPLKARQPEKILRENFYENSSTGRKET